MSGISTAAHIPRDYWRAHVEEYIRWYAEQWNNPKRPLNQ
jgi:hypothetical protein